MNCLHQSAEWLLLCSSDTAEWVAAIATGVLACFAWIPLCALRKSLGDSAKAQQDKKRADQFDRLKWLDSRFNSPAMLVARCELGKWGQNPGQAMWKPESNAWMVIYFFTQIAQMCRQELLKYDDIDLAFGDYIDILCTEFNELLNDEYNKENIEILKQLHATIDALPYARDMKPMAGGLSAADASIVRKKFWEREAALCTKSRD
ncbi:MAG: hypothetical protein ACYDBH_09635 [Acidobacteriaceae bacterium]